MKLIDVLCARYDYATERMEVVREVELEDGRTVLHLQMFARETLAARAAEYGTEDMDELVDIIIHEPFMVPVNHLNVSADQALQLHRAGRAAVKQEGKIVKAATKEERTAKLRAAGVDQKYLDAMRQDAYEVIKEHCALDAPLVRHFKERVERARLRAQEVQPSSTSKISALRLRQHELEQQSLIRRAALARKFEEHKAPTNAVIHLNRGSRT